MYPTYCYLLGMARQDRIETASPEDPLARQLGVLRHEVAEVNTYKVNACITVSKQSLPARVVSPFVYDDPRSVAQMCFVVIGATPATDSILDSRGIQARTISCTDHVLRSILMVRTAEYSPLRTARTFLVGD